ncbi:glycosyltransferase family 4 protein [Flavobacterium branchiophilum]|uniref:Glycosyl transferase family 1 n=1 Tax=Flavobacterium branchiophilum TaxID=55197 RepID=A0A2H3KMY6_9FLAO|nr:glycosyltransferase [Flavobacterium branchiophilum]PDS24910.1 glycosyl transferase family 1 [Flavobacterium branchiophilum]
MAFILYIGNKLNSKGSNPTTIDTLGKQLTDEHYVVKYASTYKNWLIRILDMLFSVIKYSFKIDYVLIDTYSTFGFWYVLCTSQCCRLLKLKYIPILHGGNLPKRLKINPLLCKLIFKNSYCNVAPSAYLYDEFKKKFNNLVLIPNTINENDYQFLLRNEIAPKLLWVRAFDQTYNPEMALYVLEKLQQSYPKATLCMVGPKKDESFERSKKLANELGLSVKFTGKLSKKEWIQLSKEFDFFINTTNFDNMPVSLIEAMSLGLVVVSTNVGGIPYLINHQETGILVNKNDVDEMVFQIYNLLNNSILYQKIAHNAQLSASQFYWGEVKYKWFEILKK